MADPAKIAPEKLALLLANNKKYADGGDHTHYGGFLDRIPGIRQSRVAAIVLSCSDPRLDIKNILGLRENHQGVFLILNPGGRAHLAINAIGAAQAVSHTGTIVVIHHSDCGMSHVHDTDVKNYLLNISPDDKRNIEAAEFGEITTDIEVTIKEDVEYLRKSPWVRKDVQIYGLKYDLVKGLLEQVV